MTRIADLLDCDFSRPVEENTKASTNDPDTVFAELSEYIVTDHIRTEYERLFSAIAAASKLPGEGGGVWISGFFGAGKSSFAKNLGHVLADRQLKHTTASSLFLKQVESPCVAEAVEFLNRAVPYEVFTLNARVELPAQNGPDQIAEAMYRGLLRGLGYAEDDHNSRLGREPSRSLGIKDLIEKSFSLCEARRPGKAFGFILDDLGPYVARGCEHLKTLRAVLEQWGAASLARMKAGKIPGPVWIIVSAQENLPDVCKDMAGSRVELTKLELRFQHRIELTREDIREVVTRRVLRKKESQEGILRKLFRDRGASLIQNVKLERSSRRTDFDEDRFVRFYPYLPHLLDLSIDMMAGMWLQPNAPKYLGSSNRTIVKQAFEMLVSDETRLAEQPVGVLVSIDKIYDLVEGNIPWEKQKDVLEIRQRYDDNKDYPGIASRVAKAICVMEFVKTDLPRTTKNIAALLIQRATDAPPALAVAAILERLEHAQFVRETDSGWKLYDFDGLRRAAAAVGWLWNSIGEVNPRNSGRHNDLVQLGKKLLARLLSWYTRPLHEFNANVSTSLEEIVSALDHLSINMVALDRLSMSMVALERRNLEDRLAPQLLDHISMNTIALDELSMNVVALEARLEQAEKRNAILENPDAPAYIDRVGASYRTAYIIGLFGTGRRYINEQMVLNIGERAKYFRDTIRLHPGPTPMIYSGHATMKHVSRAQALPEVMSRILRSAGSGFADVIFIYRHPLDSLLTNWVWWRTFLRDNRWISGISQVYKNTEDLCADFERNFQEFEAFAAGDPDFFAGVPGPRFLSFQEFVEETELHLQSATLALRLEDFIIDPKKQFSRIGEVMSVDLDFSRLCVDPPRAKPYGYRAVSENVPRFRGFMNAMNAATRRRIEKMSYEPAR